ncbi:MAG: protein kinase, partial [Anaerolineae bacterium]
MLGTKVGLYEIREEIVTGGMAAVYRAYQPNMDRDVALKVIKQPIVGDEDAVRRFHQEARLIARLEHPHILPVYDFDGGHDPPYIVMRYLDGGTLKEEIAQGNLTWARISHLMRQVGSALDYAHRQGVVHRDIKPSNIMIDRDGNAFVTDFGIARMMAGGGADAHLTATGVVIGTPNYMSPEQAQGESDIDHRTDIYALGAVLFEMLTGQLPYTSETPIKVLLMHMMEPIPRATEHNLALPPAVDEVIIRAMAKDRADRYPTATVLVEAVTAALGERVGEGSIQYVRPAVGRDSGMMIPSEQNKVVTALYASAAEYADIVEEISGRTAARKAVNALWDAVAQIVKNHHGLIFERSERDVLALWGAEMAREDDAELAIRAALAMQAALRELGAEILAEEAEEPLPLNIGLHTGLVLLTPGEESGTYTASGATISLADRLMQNAEGLVLISHDTYNQVRGLFNVELDAPLKVRQRGAAARRKLEVYQVLEVKVQALPISVRGVEGVETHMMGREAELKQLQNALLDAIEDKETQVVTIVGEAGIGKSRLLYEFINWAELHPEQLWLLRGWATPELTRRPYALVRGIISFRAGIHDNDSPATVRHKLEGSIRRQVGANDEMAHLIGHLAGFDFSDSPFIEGLLTDPQQLIERAKQLFVRWLVKMCAIRPAVMELEDIHLADAPSLDLLARLMSEHDELPLMVVCLARPVLYERRPAWGSGQRLHTRIDLSPLDRRASRSLVREILQKVADVPKALRDLLVERAEGNPYYMEELVKMLIDDRVILKESDERWRVEADRLTHMSVPPTLVGLLQARLDSLLYPEKLTLQRAAVVGRIFYDSALAALDAADETHVDDLPGILQHLVAREFIHVRETTAFAGSAEYILAGNMLRDLLENMLLRRQRQTYNAAAAEWLVQISGERVDEYSALIADYYERGEQAEKAAYYLQQAGEKSLHISAFDEARKLFERALRLSPSDAPGRLPLRLRLGEAHYRLGEYPVAREQLTTALEIARSGDNKGHIADALYWLSQVAADEGDYEQARTRLEESLPLARDSADEATLALVLYGLSGLNWRLGNFDEARADCEESLALARQIGNITQELRALNRLGAIAWGQGDLDEAQQLFEETHTRASQVGNREWGAAALNNLGEIARVRDDVAGAQAYYRKALPIVHEIGQQRLLLLLYINLAGTYIYQK